MAQGTALLERQDTGISAEATGEEIPAESDELENIAETGTEEETTETEEGQEEEPDLRNTPQVQALLKDAEARLNESFRQREENARRSEREAATQTAYQNLRKAVDPAKAVDVYREIRAVMQKVYDDGAEPKEVEGAVWQAIQNNYAAGVARAADYIVNVTDGYLVEEFKGWTVPEDVNTQFMAAQGALDYPGMLKAALKAATVAADTRGYERGKKEATEAVTKGVALKATDEARKALPRPTTGGGGGPRSNTPTWKEVQKMTKAQLEALPDGAFDAAMNGART